MSPTQSADNPSGEDVGILGRIPRFSDRIAWQAVDGEAVVVDLAGRIAAGLNRTGSALLLGVDGKRTLGDLAADLAERFAITREQAERDCELFFRDLAKREWVVLAEGKGV